MHLLMIDRWRNVKIAPAKALASDSDIPATMLTMLHLLTGTNLGSGQIELECDQECYRQFERQIADAEKKGVVGYAIEPLPNSYVRTDGARASTSYRGVPIAVIGD